MSITAFDLETKPFSPGNMAPEILVISTASRVDGEIQTRLAPGTDVGGLSDLIRSDTKLVGAHIAYDMACVFEHHPELRDRIWERYDSDLIHDVVLRDRLHRIATGDKTQSSLAKATKQWTGADLEKDPDIRLTFHQVSWPLPESHARYAKEDVIWTLRTYEAQEKNGMVFVETPRFSGELTPFADEMNQVRADFWLKLMSNRGLVTDRKAVQALQDRVSEQIAALSGRLADYGLLVKDKSGVWRKQQKEAQQRLETWSREKDHPLVRTPTGKPALTEEALESVSEPSIRLYQEYSRVTKQQTKLDELWTGVDKPIHARFRLASSGRAIASSPNVQNFPRRGGYRECVIPRPGYVFLISDISQAELHTLAQICLGWFGRSALADALNDGKDPHLFLAAVICQVDYHSAVKRLKNKDAAIRAARSAAKPANFGFPVGMGPARFIEHAKNNYGIVVSKDQAKSLKQAWKTAYPELGRYLKAIPRLFASPEDGYFTTIQPWSKRIRGGCKYTDACNDPFQGLAASGFKLAGYTLTKQIQPAGAYIVNAIHDEFIVECPAQESSRVAAWMSETIKTEFNRVVPDVPLAEQEVRIEERWTKD